MHNSLKMIVMLNIQARLTMANATAETTAPPNAVGMKRLLCFVSELTFIYFDD